jgi:hypothetical protein
MSFASQQRLPLTTAARAAIPSTPYRTSGSVVSRCHPYGSRRQSCSDGKAMAIVSERPTADLGRETAGKSFARKRIHHAIEMFGACMMMVAFLALAIFA